jgi:hypothetical protein
MVLEKGLQRAETVRMNNTVNVPIGFTYANRTELVTGSEVKGHIGFQFNYPNWADFMKPKP